MTALDIVGLGLSTLDVLIRLRDMPVWERAGSVGAFGLDGGGPVGTACVTAARLGASVGYIGTAGNDLNAELKLRSFQESGVDLSRMVVRAQPEDQIIIVHVHEDTGERIFSALRRIGGSLLRADELDRDYITSARYLHLDGFHMAAALQAARWMREAGGRVSIDCAKTDGGPISRDMIELIQYVDILICGSGFGQSLTGHADLRQAGEAILAMGPGVAVQTEGKDGSYTVTSGDYFHTPAFEVDIVDTTGAGDVFHGAYLAGLLHGWDWRTVAQFASAVAALKCTKLGGRLGIPCLPEVISFLRMRGIAIS